MVDWFNLEIALTGVCTLVTDQPIGNSPAKMHLVIVDGWENSRKPNRTGVDGEQLPCRHGAMVQFPLGNLPGAGSGGRPRQGKGVWYPKRHSLAFSFVEDSENRPELNAFKVHPELPQHVADMTKIAPGFASLGGSDVLDSNPHSDVLANALFERGTLSFTANEAEAWVFSSVLAAEPVVVQGMAAEVILTLRRLSSMTLTASRLQSGGSPRRGNPGREEPDQLTLVATRPNETVRMTIAVGCEENPLLWEESQSQTPPEDVDFRWHYEIFSPAEKVRLRDALGDAKLPVPRRPENKRLAKGRNCFPAFFTL